MIWPLIVGIGALAFYVKKFFKKQVSEKPVRVRNPASLAYAKEVNERLKWNVENAHLNKPGKWAIVLISYEKIIKGKVRNMNATLGVVAAESVSHFEHEVSMAWGDAVGKMMLEKKTPGIDMIVFTHNTAHVGWRRGTHVITDDDIAEKYSTPTVESALKQLLTL